MESANAHKDDIREIPSKTSRDVSVGIANPTEVEKWSLYCTKTGAGDVVSYVAQLHLSSVKQTPSDPVKKSPARSRSFPSLVHWILSREVVCRLEFVGFSTVCVFVFTPAQHASRLRSCSSQGLFSLAIVTRAITGSIFHR